MGELRQYFTILLGKWSSSNLGYIVLVFIYPRYLSPISIRKPPYCTGTKGGSVKLPPDGSGSSQPFREQ